MGVAPAGRSTDLERGAGQQTGPGADGGRRDPHGGTGTPPVGSREGGDCGGRASPPERRGDSAGPFGDRGGGGDGVSGSPHVVDGPEDSSASRPVTPHETGTAHSGAGQPSTCTRATTSATSATAPLSSSSDGTHEERHRLSPAHTLSRPQPAASLHRPLSPSVTKSESLRLSSPPPPPFLPPPSDVTADHAVVVLAASSSTPPAGPRPPSSTVESVVAVASAGVATRRCRRPPPGPLSPSSTPAAARMRRRGPPSLAARTASIAAAAAAAVGESDDGSGGDGGGVLPPRPRIERASRRRRLEVDAGGGREWGALASCGVTPPPGWAAVVTKRATGGRGSIVSGSGDRCGGLSRGGGVSRRGDWQTGSVAEPLVKRSGLSSGGGDGGTQCASPLRTLASDQAPWQQWRGERVEGEAHPAVAHAGRSATLAARGARCGARGEAGRAVPVGAVRRAPHGRWRRIQCIQGPAATGTGRRQWRAGPPATVTGTAVRGRARAPVPRGRQ